MPAIRGTGLDNAFIGVFATNLVNIIISHSVYHRELVGHGGPPLWRVFTRGLELLHRNIISFISSYGIIDNKHQNSSSLSSLVSRVLPLPHLSEDERTAWLFSLRPSLPIN
jgi:hypothetical protein